MRNIGESQTLFWEDFIAYIRVKVHCVFYVMQHFTTQQDCKNNHHFTKPMISLEAVTYWTSIHIFFINHLCQILIIHNSKRITVNLYSCNLNGFDFYMIVCNQISCARHKHHFTRQKSFYILPPDIINVFVVQIKRYINNPPASDADTSVKLQFTNMSWMLLHVRHMQP